MTDAAATTGQLLKAERERRGMSPQKAADELHLDAWVVDALEAEDYERVGPSVYAKGHLKRYAALLGLSPGDIMTSYESRSLSPKTPASQPANVRLRTDAAAVSNLPWTPILGSFAVALLVLGVLWWKPWQQRGAGATAERQMTETPKRSIGPPGRHGRRFRRLRRGRNPGEFGCFLARNANGDAGLVCGGTCIDASADTCGGRGRDGAGRGGRYGPSPPPPEFFRRLMGGRARCRGQSRVRRQRARQQRKDGRRNRTDARLPRICERRAARDQQSRGRDRTTIHGRRRSPLRGRR